MVAVIIDDEKRARNLLGTILKESCPDISEIHEAEDLPSGVKTIHSCHPDIVFLDVEMPTYSGIQILDFFDPEQVTFEIIFTTAYQEYALRAFELNAISYLLKPLRPKQIKEAVKKASDKLTGDQIKTQLHELKNSLNSKSPTKIGLPASEGIIFVKLEDIYYLKADGMYTEVYSSSNPKIVVSKPLRYFADQLKGIEYFFRTHRSFIVNLENMKQIVKKDGGYIIMDNDEIVSVSRERLDELLLIQNL